MFRLEIAVVFLYLSIALCLGQIVDYAKLRQIYMDMDNDIVGETNRFIDDLTKPEVIEFFRNMSSGPDGEGILYRSFDYWWGTAYSDSPSVTQFFFVTWDHNKNSVLDLVDLDVMYEAIDQLKTEPANSLSQIDFNREFYPYFETLYIDAWTNGTTRK